MNPNGVMSTYRNDPSFSDESLMASEGEKSVISIVNHNQSSERPGNFLTKNRTDANNFNEIMNVAPIYQLCKQNHRKDN